MILCFNSFAPPRPLIGIALMGRQFKSTMNRPCTDLFILRYCFIACHQSIIKCAWFCAYFQSVESVYGGMVPEYNIIIIFCFFTPSWVSSYRGALLIKASDWSWHDLVPLRALLQVLSAYVMKRWSLWMESPVAKWMVFLKLTFISAE